MTWKRYDDFMARSIGQLARYALEDLRAFVGKDRAMTCLSCRHSVGNHAGLWCTLHLREAKRRCPQFEYEPGTDE